MMLTYVLFSSPCATVSSLKDFELVYLCLRVAHYWAGPSPTELRDLQPLFMVLRAGSATGDGESTSEP